jgi:beta-lactamase regulating signal transducer with metallopeptidase domain
MSFAVPSFWQLLGGIYLAGVSVFALRLVLSLLAVRRLKRQATDLQDAAWQRALRDSLSQTGSQAKVRLMQSAEISVPIACGWLEPTIVIPADLVGALSASARKGVLVHEIVHLLRRDYPWQLLLRALQVVLWFHPLLWWVERRINFIRERVCDDFSIFILGDSDVYCDTLLDIAARCHNRLSLSLGLAIVQTSRLAKRLAALDESRGCRAWKASARSKGVLAILALAVAAAVSPLATKSVMLAEEPKAESSQPAPAKPEPKQTIHPITVTGRALDSDGKPIEGATIFLISTGRVQQTLGETKTGRDGNYEFRNAKLPVPKLADADFLEQGAFLVFGKAPGRAFSWRGMKTLCIDPRFVGADGKLDARQRETGYLPGEKIELDLTFASPRPVTGRIVDEQGRPVSKVEIDLGNCDFLNTAGKESHLNYREFWGINQASELMPEQFSAVSDAEGKFQLPHAPPEMVVWLLLKHADYAGATLYTATSDSPPAEHDGHPVEKLPLTIKLRGVRTVPVEVTFFDTGKPAKDVSVSAYEKRASGTYANGKSDEMGRVTLKLPPGRYKFLGDPPQDSDYIRTMQELVVEETPASQPAALKLDSGCVIVFKATDADTGKGVPGVSFWYEMDEPKGSRTGVQANTTYISHPKTNDKGELRAVVIPGKRQYGIGWSPLPDGYRAVDPTDQSHGRELTCAAGKKVVVEFKVRKASK